MPAADACHGDGAFLYALRRRPITWRPAAPPSLSAWPTSTPRAASPSAVFHRGSPPESPTPAGPAATGSMNCPLAADRCNHVEQVLAGLADPRPITSMTPGTSLPSRIGNAKAFSPSRPAMVARRLVGSSTTPGMNRSSPLRCECWEPRPALGDRARSFRPWPHAKPFPLAHLVG